MNKSFTKALAWGLLCMLSISFAACKKSESTTTDPGPAKTLNKSSLTNNKEWYSKGNATIHIFKANGVYSNTGTWSWTSSTSDTLKLLVTPSSSPVYWKMFWNTEHEMSCRRISSNGVEELYKDQGW